MTSTRVSPTVVRRVALATATIVLALGASKLVGFVREILVASVFGTGFAADSFMAANEVPEQIFVLISAGAISSAFIPVLSGLLQKEDRREASRLASAILTLTFIVGIILATLVALFAEPIVVQTVGRGFDPQRRQLTIEVLRIILLSFVLFGVGGVFQGILNAHQHFLLPAIAPVLHNTGIIIGALFFAPRWGIHGLAWGVVLGSVLYVLVQVPGLYHYGLRYRPQLGLSNPEVLQVGRLVVPRVISLGLFELTTFVNATLASSLAVGSITALRYGWSLMQLPETLFATTVGQAVFPTLAEMANNRRYSELRSTMAGTLRAIFTLTVPSAVGLIVLGRPMVQTVFERGAFNADSTNLVVWALQCWALGLVGHSSLEVVARTFYAMKDTVTPFRVAAGAFVVNLALALWLRGPLGVGGLALANSIAFTAQVLVLLWLLRRRLEGIEGGRLLSGLARIVVSALAMGAVVLLVTRVLGGQRPYVVAAAGGLAGVVVYVGLIYALGLDEARLLPRLVRQRLQRRAAVAAGD